MRALVDLRDSQIEALDDLAKLEKLSRAALIRQAVDDFLAKRTSSPADVAFGLWGESDEDGLAYQERLRNEW